MKYIIAVLALFAVTACADDKPDYAASARCQDQGNKPGTAEYDRCVREEKSAALMEQQRREYEDMKQQQQDWKLRGY